MIIIIHLRFIYATEFSSIKELHECELQSCAKLVGTHALLIICKFINKIYRYVYKMTFKIQYPCFKHASSPSLRHQAVFVYTYLLFIHSAPFLPTLISGSEEQIYYKMSQQFYTRSWFSIQLTTIITKRLLPRLMNDKLLSQK